MDSHQLQQRSRPRLWVGGVLGVFAWEALNIDGPLAITGSRAVKWESTVFCCGDLPTILPHMWDGVYVSEDSFFLLHVHSCSVAPSDHICDELPESTASYWLLLKPIKPQENLGSMKASEIKCVVSLRWSVCTSRKSWSKIIHIKLGMPDVVLVILHSDLFY